jgi:hypothetical protein
VALVAEHCPQAPLAWQAGVAPLQSPSALQARQVRVVASQIGVVPPHCASETQATQVPEMVRQYGVEPPHWVVLEAEHCPQVPPGWQAGVAPPHSPSLMQMRQTCVASQTGLLAGQSAALKQETQLPLVTWQSGLVPVHCVVLAAEHCPQAPLG